MREDIEPRTVASLSRLEKAWLRRRACGWCDGTLLASQCASLFRSPECDMDMTRGLTLAAYRPRADAGKDAPDAV